MKYFYVDFSAKFNDTQFKFPLTMNFLRLSFVFYGEIQNGQAFWG